MFLLLMLTCCMTRHIVIMATWSFSRTTMEPTGGELKKIDVTMPLGSMVLLMVK